jgi:hypothetical protein
MSPFLLMVVVVYDTDLLPATPGLRCNEPDTAGSYGVPSIIFLVARSYFHFVPKGKFKLDNDFEILRKHLNEGNSILALPIVAVLD